MEYEKQRRNYALFLIAGAGLVNIARAMTLLFLAVKLQQTFGLGPAMIGALLGVGPLLGAIAAPFAGSLSDKVGRKTMLTLTLLSMALAMIGMGIAETVLAFCDRKVRHTLSVAHRAEARERALWIERSELDDARRVRRLLRGPHAQDVERLAAVRCGDAAAVAAAAAARARTVVTGDGMVATGSSGSSSSRTTTMTSSMTCPESRSPDRRTRNDSSPTSSTASSNTWITMVAEVWPTPRRTHPSDAEKS